MEIVLAVFSAISVLSTAILAVLLFQILRRNQALEQKLSELLDAQSKSSDKVCETLRGSGEMQARHLQLVANKLEALKTSLEESIKF